MLRARHRSISACALLATVLPLASVAESEESSVQAAGPEAPPAANVERRSYFPLLADEALKRGYELPLPYGASLVLTGLANREIEVTDVRLDLDGVPVAPNADFVDLGSSSDVFNANLKFDVFVLPFLNVYALVGYVRNESETTADITMETPGPGGGDVVFEGTVTTELDGMIGGLGFALAGGYGNFFLVADCSYIRSDLGFDDDFTATIATVRAGYRGAPAGFPMQTWIGVGSWDTAATAIGHSDLPGGARFTFEADQRPHTKWMYDVGANFEFSRQFQLVTDVGFDFEGGYLLVVGPTWRFGG
jgi:hypothetical protein